MFKRYVLFSHPESLIKGFDIVQIDSLTGLPNYNVSPGTSVPIIVSGPNRDHHLKQSTWDGFLFSLSENQSALTSAWIRKTPDLVKVFQRKRCVIPMNGYYEWKKVTEAIQIPFYFRILNRELFGVAGLYEIDEKGTFSFVPIETRANEIVEPLSETMPAIISDELVHRWLDPLYPNPDLLHDILSPHRTIEMSSYRVTLKQSDTQSNTKNLIQPVV
jgi:putative SOS response-associated peptidase YedK